MALFWSPMLLSMKRTAFVLFTTACMFSLLRSSAQPPPSSVLQHLEASFKKYTLHKKSVDLFLHVDKQVYVPNENIWFTAYLFSQDSRAPKKVLYCLLVEKSSKKIILKDRFVINGSFSGGALFLPDSIKNGEYDLIAYTDPAWAALPGQHIFRQALTVKTLDGPLFKWDYLPVENAPQNDSVYFKYKVTTAYGGVAAGAVVDYSLLADGVVIQMGRQLVNPFGEIALVAGRQEILSRCIELRATLNRQQEAQHVSMVVPLLQDVFKVHFYPEGGNLVHHQLSAMGIEIRDVQGTPIAAKAELREEGLPVASFVTDQYGMGMVKWIPDSQKTYTIHLEDTDRALVYEFPHIKSAGYSLHVPQAVGNDSTLRVEIAVPSEGDTCHLVAHNFRSVFFSGTLVVKERRAVLNLPAASMQQGIVTLTLFNRAGQPQAERAVYRIGTPALKVEMEVDSAVYHHRSRVQLKVKITDSLGQPVQSFFSLACVLASRLDAGRTVDISRFWHFDRFLPAMGALPSAKYFEERENVERLLLVRYWTRYNWESIHIANQVADNYSPGNEKNCDTGKVYFKNWQVSNPVPMVIVGGERPYLFKSDFRGHFDVPAEALKAAPGRKVMVMPAMGNKSKSYRVEMYNGCAAFDSTLAIIRFPDAKAQVAEWSVQEQQLMKKALKPVVVRAKRIDWEAYAEAAEKLARNCEGDWVCMYNILNCPNHPAGRKPVNGEKYYVLTSEQLHEYEYVVYQCGQVKEEAGDFVKELNSVKNPKEFYVADYSKFNPAMPEMMSTIFWSYQIVTDEKGEAEVAFYTNDLEGTIHCVLQGVSDKGPVSKRVSLVVK